MFLTPGVGWKSIAWRPIGFMEQRQLVVGGRRGGFRDTAMPSSAYCVSPPVTWLAWPEKSHAAVGAISRVRPLAIGNAYAQKGIGSARFSGGCRIGLEVANPVSTSGSLTLQAVKLVFKFMASPCSLLPSGGAKLRHPGRPGHALVFSSLATAASRARSPARSRSSPRPCIREGHLRQRNQPRKRRRPEPLLHAHPFSGQVRSVGGIGFTASKRKVCRCAGTSSQRCLGGHRGIIRLSNFLRRLANDGTAMPGWRQVGACAALPFRSRGGRRAGWVHDAESRHRQGR